MDFAILNWNVRGLNNPVKRRVVQNFVTDLKCNLVCLQETKINDITRTLVLETLGQRFANNFISLPAIGTRGGILIACMDDFELSIVPLVAGVHSISGMIRDRSDGACWSITGVYGPPLEADKMEFMAELRRIK